MMPTGTGNPVAARQLDIFLDLLGFLSSTAAAFFLDPTYCGLTCDEEALRTALMKVVNVASHDVGTVGHLLRQFLLTLGTP